MENKSGLKHACQIAHFRKLNILPIVNVIILFMNSNLGLTVDYSTLHHQNRPSYMRINRCYSCMSTLYEDLFKYGHLSRLFFEPKNFTSECDNSIIDRNSNIGLVPCRGICLTLIQEFWIFGRKTGKTMAMRGCANSLSKIGYQNTTIAFFEQYDRCLKLTAGELFNFEDRPEISNYEPNQAIDQLSSDQSQLILVCSCFGDRCNNGSKNSAILSFRPMNLYLLLFFVLGIAGFLKKIVL